MKTLIKIIFLGLLSVLLTIAATAKTNDPVKQKHVSEKDKGLFVFKADRELVGAKVEILRENGSVIAEQVLNRRKLVIDFNEIRSGSYTIRISKGEKIKEFNYYKQ
jgi:hypothetical protein